MYWLFFWMGFIQLFALEVPVRAKHAVLMNGKTGAILYEKQAHLPAYPASTTKIGIALYLLEKCFEGEKKACVSREALRFRPAKDWELYPAYWHDRDGVLMGLKVGEELSYESLLYGLLLFSANDAANVLAESVGGTIPHFMDAVNAYLEELGCKNTKFSNPHGLTHPEHWTSAYDLAWMTRRALSFPLFCKVFGSVGYLRPDTNKQKGGQIYSNCLLLKPKSPYFYSKAIGAKTGYTAAAGFNLVAAAEQEGRVLIAVLLGCENKWERYEDAKNMFEAAFSEEKKERKIFGKEHVFSCAIEGGEGAVKAHLLEPLSIAFFPSEEPKCTAVIRWDKIALPIRKGEKVAEVEIVDEKGGVWQKRPLFAKEGLKGTFWWKLTHFFR